MRRMALFLTAATLLAGCGESKPPPDGRTQHLTNLGIILAHGTSDERQKAARELGELGDPRAVTALAAALHDNRATVRTAAVDAMVKLGEPSLGPLLAALAETTDDNAREAAAAGLGRLGNDKAVGPLLEALSAKRPIVRSAAAEALGSFAGPNVIARLAAVAADDADDGVSVAAVGALGRIADPQAAGELIRVLVDALAKKPGGKGRGPGRAVLVGNAARKALVSLGPAARDTLLAALKGDNALLRPAAAELLGETGDRQAAAALAAAVKEGDAETQRRAVEALTKIGGPEALAGLADALDSSDAEARGLAIAYLAEQGHKPVVPTLIAALKTGKGSPKEYIRPLGVLKDGRAVAPLLDVFQNPGSYSKASPGSKGSAADLEELRQEAAEALGEIGEPKAAGPLLAELKRLLGAVKAIPYEGRKKPNKDDDAAAKDKNQPEPKPKLAAPAGPGMRDMLSTMAALCHALGKLHDAAAVETICEVAVLDRGWPPSHQAAAISALALLGDPKATDALIPNLEHWDPSTRHAAVRALGRIRDVRAARALLSFLKDRLVQQDFKTTQETAAEGVAWIGELAVPALLERLGDENLAFRSSVVHILARVGEPSLGPLTEKLRDGDPAVRQGAAWALGSELWAKDSPRAAVAVAPLCQTLKDADPAVRKSAAYGLGMIADRSAVGPLTELLADGDVVVRKTGIWALGRIGDAGVVERIIPCLRDGDDQVRGSAAIALGEIGDRRALGPLAAMEKSETARLSTLVDRLKRAGKIKPDGRLNTRDMPTDEERHALGTHRAMRELARGAIERIGERPGK